MPSERHENVFRYFEGRCSYGGKRLTMYLHGEYHSQGWELDHGNPRAQGGSDHGMNHRLACFACNRFKGANTSQWWQYRIREYYDGRCPTWRDGKPVKKH